MTQDWTPVRNGHYYCSPACGGGKFCRHEWYKAAVKNAEALCERMGDGWVPEVWENLGWHYKIVKGRVTIHVNEMKTMPFDPVTGYSVRGYSAWIEPNIVLNNHHVQIIEKADTPEDALGFAVQSARTLMSRMRDVLDVLNEVTND
jgi:hypothetical protein